MRLLKFIVEKHVFKVMLIFILFEMENGGGGEKEGERRSSVCWFVPM